MLVDAFLFHNELDLLELRLHTLDPVVDRFLLVEMTKTHAGKDKPLFFTGNRSRFSAFSDKIKRVVLDPPSGSMGLWEWEAFQRNAIGAHVKADDTVLVSDVDEIPRPESILFGRDWAQYHNVVAQIVAFQQTLYYYWLNCRCADPWVGTRMAQGAVVQRAGAQALRNSATPTLYLYNGGWHFSYLGGVRGITEKITAYSHQEYNTAQYLDPQHIEQCIKNGVDLFGRDIRYEFVPIDTSFPPYVREHYDRFKELIFHG